MRVRVTADAKGSYAEQYIGQVGLVVHADADSTMKLIRFDSGGACDIEEKYLEAV